MVILQSFHVKLLYIYLLIIFKKDHEEYDYFPGYEADLEELVETHNYIPGYFIFCLI